MTVRANLAVVARRSEPPESLDFFPTPPWGTRAFASLLRDRGLLARSHSILEPACGEGHMAAVLQEFIDAPIFASDIFPYGFGDVADFLDGGVLPGIDWIITNPPFNKSIEFVQHALTHPGAKARIGVAVLVRLSWLEGQERALFFRDFPPHLVAVHADRLPMHKGRWEPEGKSSTAYCWVVFLQRDLPLEMKPQFTREPRLAWIGPGARKFFTDHNDARRFGALRPAPLLDAVAP